MKSKVRECSLWTICMYCSQNNMLITVTVISSGIYESDCVLTTVVNWSWLSQMP